MSGRCLETRMGESRLFAEDCDPCVPAVQRKPFVKVNREAADAEPRGGLPRRTQFDWG